MGQGDGTFNAKVDYGVGGSPYCVAVGDFNGDSKPDLVTANGNVSVLLGQGDGTFNAKVEYGAGGNPYGVAVGDFNSDGKPDLVTANPMGNNVSVLLGQGDGTFNAKMDYGAGQRPYSVAVGDFNSDDKADLAVANQIDSNVSILLGQGDGTFNAAVNYGTEYCPLSVAVGDFNRDGKPDLVTADSNYVSVLLNYKLTYVDLTGSIPAPAGGSVFDLDSLSLAGRNQYGQPYNMTGLPVTWACSDTAGRILNGHYLVILAADTAGSVTATIDGVTSNTLSFLPINADLKELSVSPGSIGSFDRDTVAYSVDGCGAAASLSVTATADDSRSTLTISGQPAASSVAQAVYLNHGANLIPIVVTAVDGQTQKAYVLSVNGTVSDANLDSLSVSTGDIAFNADTTSYNQTVDTGTSNLTLTAGPHDPRALVILNGNPLASGASRTVNLAYGVNNIEVMVVAQDASTKTYTITVTRGYSSITWNTGSLEASNVTGTGLTLIWPAAVSEAGIASYQIYQDSTPLSTVSGSVYSCSTVGLSPGTLYTFSVKAVDTGGNVSSELSLTTTTLSSFSIDTGVISQATLGVAYSCTLAASGGKTPYTWSAAGLPAGLSLNTSTGEITGTPTLAGDSVINVTLIDSAGMTISKGFVLDVFHPAGTGRYTITPATDSSYTTGTTTDGITTLTVNSGVAGFKYFTVNVALSESHSGNEVAVFVQFREGSQIAVNATRADFDQVGSAVAAFNVQPGDVIKVYVVDDLTNDEGFNPTLLQ
ncbi:MAG TPA: FG-GAP-like repeat-containing protein [Syntrophomonadaceae bacterium]|nr:FG-GAP-like repeat-containing protein [Syntrophomonadaceae bacterium]